MTQHKDIYTKFMIDYDKASVTSSYPSLTQYEIATILDKAYMALISQKVTGNNVRRTPFEADIKSISDLQGLVCTEKLSQTSKLAGLDYIDNLKSFSLPSNFLYFVSATGSFCEDDDYDKTQNIKLVSHGVAQKFFETQNNKPWIKDPVAFIEQGKMNVVYDPVRNMQHQTDSSINTVSITFIHKPNSFIPASASVPIYASTTPFECSDNMAQELVSLAVAFALENVESQRLNSKLNMRGLEA